MSQAIRIVQASTADSQCVSELILPLLNELYPEEPIYTKDNLLAATQQLLSHPQYWVFVAYDDDKPVGVIALNECTAIYALGSFGEITELYVVPGYRSLGVGARLIDAAKQWGKERHWSMLEVGAPDVPVWQRTVDFYQNQGFKVVGPRLYQML